MNTKHILAAVTLFGISMASQSVLAATIVATYSGSANFGSGPVGYAIGSITPNPNSNTSPVGVGIGGDSFTSANHDYAFSATGKFNTWCVDIYHWLSGGTLTYDVQNGSNLAAELSILRPVGPSGTTRVNQMIQLANAVFNSVKTETDSAAFQLAIWAISYGTLESGQYRIDTTNPGFRVDNSTAISAWGVEANLWLSELGTAPITGNYALTYLSDGTRENTQDLIVFTVPEPGSLPLLGLGLAGIGFLDHKKAQQFKFTMIDSTVVRVM